MRTRRRTFQGLTPLQLEEQWRRRHNRSRRSARHTRFRIAFMIVVGFVSGLIGVWNGFGGVVAGLGGAELPVAPEPGDASNVLLGVTPEQAEALAPSAQVQLPLHLLSLAAAIVGLVLIVLVIRNVRKYLHERMNLDVDTRRFPLLSEAATKAVDALLVPLCERMKVDRSRIRLLRSKNSRAFSPSIVENTKTGTILLVIPSDFLSVLTEDPQAAEAMLAHELGHVVQKDSSLWLYASAFADQLMRYFLPMHLFNLLYVVVTLTMMVVVFWPLDLSALPFALYLFFLGVVPLLSLLYFFRQIRRTRRSSEELADLAAWIYAVPHGVGLQKAFALYDAQKAKVQTSGDTKQKPTLEEEAASFGFFGDVFSKSRHFGIHPPIDYRIQKVRHYDSVTTGQVRRLRLTNYGFVLESALVATPIIVALLAAILFPVFAQAREKARQVSCLSNQKQLGTALMMYVQDWDERLPGSLNAAGENIPDPDSSENVLAWSDAVMPYIKNPGAYQCPNAKAPESPANPSRTPTSYLYNGIMALQSMGAIAYPADTIMLHEDDRTRPIGQQAPSLPRGSILNGEMPDTDAPEAVHFNRARYDRQHDDGANIGFMDGHVKWFRKDTIRYEWFGAPQSMNGPPETLEIEDIAADAAYERPRKASLGDFTSP